jgi:hypothetical protein
MRLRERVLRVLVHVRRATLAFGRFPRAFDRRRVSQDLPLDTTVAAGGGNLSKQLLLQSRL